MQWWCVAQERPWSWSWQPYPGVWIFLLLLGAGYLWALRRLPPDPAGPDSP